MKSGITFGCLPTAIGSMPNTEPAAACREVLKYLPQIPAWPQLPLRSPLENQYVQASEGFPGVTAEGGHMQLNRYTFDERVETLYQAYLARDYGCCPISDKYAAGMHAFHSIANGGPIAVKGQMTGPVTWGLGLTQPDQKPAIYDDTISDAVAKFLNLKAMWQENFLREICPRTIIFLDEPSLSYFGSAFVSLSKEQVLKLLNEVFQGLSGLKGVHC
ncbi:MAG: hypothetical protein HYX87_01480 [Chloroflexi bacterium]|nr:hypothetical protein [Chloroflexota bacterium]